MGRYVEEMQLCDLVLIGSVMQFLSYESHNSEHLFLIVGPAAALLVVTKIEY